jgi:hypothetical protein
MQNDGVVFDLEGSAINLVASLALGRFALDGDVAARDLANTFDHFKN